MKLPSTVQRATAALTRASVAVCAVMGAFAAPPAQALDVYMRVGQFSQAMPDGTTVQMWGYRIATNANAALNGALSSPGPAITVPPNDGTLRIRLLNRLPVPTSIVLHGQSAAMAPVYKLNATVNDTTVTSDCTPALNESLDCRVRSFTHETPPGNTTPVDYVFSNVKPGTFLYQSGTLPQIQVQMGLYGMMRKNAPATAMSGLNAYPNVPYDNEIGLLLSEVDPAVHAAVASGNFTGSTLHYDPKYFRVHRYGTANNAVPVDDTASPSKNPLTIQPGNRMLLRMLNAGLKSRSMVVDDGHWYVMAEDGSPYPFPREQHSVFLPAAKTSDVWFTPTVGNAAAIDRTMTVFDRNLALSNNNAQAVGGMLFQMRVDTTPRLPSLDISSCPLTGTEDQPYAGCTVSSTGPGQRSYSLDIAPIGMTIDPATGVIAWTPTNDQAQRPADPTLTNPLRVRAVDSNGGIKVSPIVQIAVSNTNDAPLALNDSYTVRGGALTVGVLQSVRANDSDPDGDVLGNVSLILAPTAATDALTLNPNGTFAFTTTDYTADRVANFTYQVTDGQALSNNGMVTLNIKANVAPTARDDMVAMLFSPNATIDVDVLANDFDLDNNMDVGTLAIPGTPSCGGGTASVVSNAGPGGRPLIRYTLPPAYQGCAISGGTDSLTYTVSDSLGKKSLPATVRVNIQ